MISIRNNVFETNSSSLHAVVIAGGYIREDIDDYIKHNGKQFNCSAGLDFSERRFIERNSPEYKASYVFQSVIQHYNSLLKNADSKELWDSILSDFNKWMSFTADAFQSNYDAFINLKFTDYSIRYDNDKPFIYCEGWTGCYGNESIVAYLTPGLYDFMDFVFGKNSVILQGSDEMPRKEVKKLESRVKHYMKKNNYRSTVIYPIGG